MKSETSITVKLEQEEALILRAILMNLNDNDPNGAASEVLKINISRVVEVLTNFKKILDKVVD